MSEHLQASTPDYDPTRDLDPEIHPFELDQRLAGDCILMGHFALSELLLMNDAQYPWFILVPRRPSVTEIYQLSQQDQQQLLLESSMLASNLADIFDADKMNVAALGNVVSQLHLHHVVRYQGDPAWPAPVWGKEPPRPYSDEQVQQLRERINTMLDDVAEYRPC